MANKKKAARSFGVFGSSFILLPTAKNERRSPLVRGVRQYIYPLARGVRVARECVHTRQVLFIASPTRDNCNTIFHKFFDILGIYTEGSLSMQKVV
jgi:hypothetical protein